MSFEAWKDDQVWAMSPVGCIRKKSVVEIQVMALASLKMTALLGNWAV
jgi:hypothetical protein